MGVEAMVVQTAATANPAANMASTPNRMAARAEIQAAEKEVAILRTVYPTQMLLLQLITAVAEAALARANMLDMAIKAGC